MISLIGVNPDIFLYRNSKLFIKFCDCFLFLLSSKKYDGNFLENSYKSLKLNDCSF